MARTDQAIANLRQHVEELEGVVPSAIALMQGLFDEFEAVKDDPEEIQALVDRGRPQVQALAQAVNARAPQNPPAEPTPA